MIHRRTLFSLGVLFPAFLSLSCGSRNAVVESAPPAAASDPARIVLPADSPQLTKIRVETVSAADVPAKEIVAPGKIESNPNRIAHVVLPVAGRVASVLVKVGDFVQQGAPLLRLESPDVDAAVSTYLQGQGSVAQATAALRKANADLERIRDLYEHSAIARKEVLNAEIAAAQAQSVLDQATASVQQSQRRLQILGLTPDKFAQQLTLSAPLSGRITELTVAPGEFRNDLSASLITIADLSSVWIAADVPESEIRFVHPGERIEIELTAFPGETFHGRILRLADMVDPQARTIRVRAELDNTQGRLRPEMFGRVRHAGGTQQLPVVDESAVLRRDAKTLVYVEESPGRFVEREVTLGLRVGRKLSVTSGLQAGERVVVEGSIYLRNGS